MLLIVAACLAMLVMGKMNVQETVFAVGLLASAVISAFGHIFAKDANAPDAQINVTQVGDEIRLEATAQETPTEGQSK
jgi:hypothetical protein